MTTIAIIPARGSSKGIPRKNLRPVAGKPMIYYAIKACLEANNVDRVIVSTEDEEIALLSERFGAEVVPRPSQLAEDAITIDPVIEQCVCSIEETAGKPVTIVATVQPTSPLIKASDIEKSIDLLSHRKVDTVISAAEDKHLCWTIENGEAIPKYQKRVNRQYLPQNYKETGAVIACTREQLKKGSRIGNKVELLILPASRSFDIDSVEDLFLCESILRRKNIVFTVIGNERLGMGHAYRALMIAQELVNHNITFLCETRSGLAAKLISEHHYNVETIENDGFSLKIAELNADLVINDILDTNESYIKALKQNGCKVVNFEDLGSGSQYANLVINALYSETRPSSHIYSGPSYFCLRDEFIYAPKYTVKRNVQNVLITFGGTDEGDLTYRALGIVLELANQHNFSITVIVGPGYSNLAPLKEKLKKINDQRVTLISKTNRISDYMMGSDFAITSGGRTVLELASLGVPTIVICQNARETQHTYASIENGVLNLGHRQSVSDSEISNAVKLLLLDYNTRQLASDKLKSIDLSDGKTRVVNAILKTLEN